MLAEKVQKALNDQINAELYSAYLYLAMAAWFESVNLHGFAHWMRLQAREEMGHAQKIFDYVCERGGRVTLKAIEEPPAEWKSPLDAFEAVAKHERHVSSRIDELVDVAREAKDNATDNFLQWFVAEQVEEESSADGIVAMLKLAKDAPGALLMVDRQLGARE